MLRVHTDRECAFLSRAFQSFCRKFGLYLANHDGRKSQDLQMAELKVKYIK